MPHPHDAPFDPPFDEADAWLAEQGYRPPPRPADDALDRLLDDRLQDADDPDAADDLDALDDDFPLGDGTADTSSEVACPYCGEWCEITLDPGSGATQSYVEDCPVCCRPWQVTVQYDTDGAAHVHCDADDALLDD
ncbi:MAG TPA: CPXCG motif-containing cysteine-rich protein [Gemmatimonadaceae bacterium]|nr:CPXCG motif-containing cysteine-rich protein [Gemmatimonadaceae bacterium]